MRNLKKTQQALINIFKVSIKKGPLKELVRTCHIELEKLIGKDKTKNFYLALHMGDANYIMPYYQDEEDNDEPFGTLIPLGGGLTEYVRLTGRTELVDKQRVKELTTEGKIKEVVGGAVVL